jgi:multidrug efflux pump subunit AcrB
MGIVGTMGLIGVAINDSIVVLAALRENQEARTGDPAAVRDVVLRSTRHVLSTTLTTIAGFLPLILGGGGFWPPLATAIAGGVSGATIMALYLIPSGYVLAMCPRCPHQQRNSTQKERAVDIAATLSRSKPFRGVLGRVS